MSAAAFTALVALVGIQRLFELRKSRRNQRAMLARGGVLHRPDQMKWMAAVHAGWLAAMPLEVFLLSRPFLWPLALSALAVFFAGQGLRYAAIRALGWRWTVRVMTVPGQPPVTGGLYRAVRHPNYLGVALEIAALPLVHTAWMTSAVFSALNALVLRRRIQIEEEALSRSDSAR